MGDSLPGTLVVDEDEIGDDMERQLITGVAYNRNEAKITLVNVPDRPGAVATIFSPLAEANINVDMIIQNIAHDEGSSDVTFRSEEHTSELQSLMRITYHVICLKTKKKQTKKQHCICLLICK